MLELVHEVAIVGIDENGRVLFGQRCLAVVAVSERETSIEIRVLEIGEFLFDARKTAQNASKFDFVSGLKKERA